MKYDEFGTSLDEKNVIEQVKQIKHFYCTLSAYLVIIPLLFIFNYVTAPKYIWAWWPALGWGIGLVCQGLAAFQIVNLFGAEWERAQIEKRLGRKLQPSARRV